MLLTTRRGAGVKVHVTRELVDALARIMEPRDILLWFDRYIPALNSTPRTALLDGRYAEVLLVAESYSEPPLDT